MSNSTEFVILNWLRSSHRKTFTVGEAMGKTGVSNYETVSRACRRVARAMGASRELRKDGTVKYILPTAVTSTEMSRLSFPR